MVVDAAAAATTAIATAACATVVAADADTESRLFGLLLLVVSGCAGDGVGEAGRGDLAS